MHNSTPPTNHTGHTGQPDHLVSVIDTDDKVERIRELLFGAQMHDYTQRLAAISHDLLSLTQETAQISKLLQEQESRFTKLLRQEIDHLTTQLQDQGKRTQQQLQQVDQRVTEQMKQLDQSQTQSVNTLAQGMARAEQDLRTALHELSQQLNSQKVDRLTLGDLLIDLGQSLKSTEPTPLPVAADLLDQLSQELA